MGIDPYLIEWTHMSIFTLDQIFPVWKSILETELNSLNGIQLEKYLTESLNEGNIIYPSFDKVFEAFRFFDLNDTKVVIIGMDPYFNENQAMGLSFSVPSTTKIPPSLKNIYKEIQTDLCVDISHRTGDLTDWAKQGVLLLNSVLTVQKGHAGSNSGIGWQTLTDAIISKLNELDKPIVFLLWGNYAKQKMSLLTNKKHLSLVAVHPSPFSASNGFFGCKHFSKTNEFLVKNGQKEINWVGGKL